MHNERPVSLTAPLASFLSPTQYVAMLAAPHTSGQKKARSKSQKKTAKNVSTKNIPAPARPKRISFELHPSIQPSIKFSHERLPTLLLDADTTPGTVQYLLRANLLVIDAKHVLPDSHTSKQVLEFARIHKNLLLTHSWKLIERGNDPWRNAGIVILPCPEPGKRIPASPDACGDLRDALDEFLKDLPYLARRRQNKIYDYRSGLAERVHSLKVKFTRRLEF